MASILVTGASGFLGSHLVGSLVADGHTVHAILRGKPSTPHGLIALNADLADGGFVSQLPPRIDAVIHLAQSRHYRLFPDYAPDILAVNVHATALLADYARRAGASRFIFTSSGGVYGHSEERLVETAPASPLNYYLASKYAAELLLASYRRFFHTIILRPFFLYGPGQSGMLVSNLLAKVRSGEDVVIEGDPGLRLNPLFVNDAVAALRATLDLDRSAVINLCGDDTVSLTRLVGLMGEAVGRTPHVTHRSSQAIGDLVGDNTSMKNLLGICSPTGLGVGLRLTVAGAG